MFQENITIGEEGKVVRFARAGEAFQYVTTLATLEAVMQRRYQDQAATGNWGQSEIRSIMQETGIRLDALDNPEQEIENIRKAIPVMLAADRTLSASASEKGKSREQVIAVVRHVAESGDLSVTLVELIADVLMQKYGTAQAHSFNPRQSE